MMIMHTKIHLMGGKTIYISKILNRLYIGIGEGGKIPEFEDMVAINSQEIEELVATIKMMEKFI